MSASIPQVVRHLIEQYRRFLRTSYRFADPALREQFEQHLAGSDVIVKGPYVTLARDFAKGRRLREVVASGGAERELLRAHWAFGDATLFRHQERALEIGRAGRSLLVTTGTGSGKTETFLLPVLDDVLRRKRQGVRGVQALLLYPMNALANDQLERLRSLLRGSGLDVSFGLYTGDSDESSKKLRVAAAETERVTHEQVRESPPDLLLTNYKQLEFLLVRKRDRALFSPSLRWLIADELHTYRGALATEIACLVRRLKAHAGKRPGELLVIGTSATVAAQGDGRGLVEFAQTLFGESFASDDVLGEEFTTPPRARERWTPPPPRLDAAKFRNFDASNDAGVIRLAEDLTGRRATAEGSVPRRIAGLLEGNVLVEALEDLFATPRAIDDSAKAIRDLFADRRPLGLDEIRREIESYLLVGSVGDDEKLPRLRPKLHVFFHGVYDVWLCMNPACRTLVPQGGATCPRCESVARPAAICRTCGQDFVKLKFRGEDDDHPVGSGDYFSEGDVGYLTHGIHAEQGGDGEGDEDEEEPPEGGSSRGSRRPRRKKGDLDDVGFCTSCGRITEAGVACGKCRRATVAVKLKRGKLNTCPACGDGGTRFEIVTPLRTGTASTVSVLATHHLDHLRDEDRKLLVFGDNRQDVAHQAGYTADKHKGIALRHAIASELKDEKSIAFDDLPSRLLARYQKLGIADRRPTSHEKDTWLAVLRYLVATEFTRHARQRSSLEHLGLAIVDYEFVEGLKDEPEFKKLAVDAGVSLDDGIGLVRAVLDVMRKQRAVAWPFFQAYLDPLRKPWIDWEPAPYGVRYPDKGRGPAAFALGRPDHLKGRLSGFVQEGNRGRPPGPHAVAARLLESRGVHDARAAAKGFLEGLVPLLVKERILERVPNFPLPRGASVAGLEILQIAPRVLRLERGDAGFRCTACRTVRSYALPVCPTPRCTKGRLEPATPDSDNYYTRLYLDHAPQRLLVAEHSAQLDAKQRAERETDFKEGRLDVLVCSPTLELGVDIGPLLTVVLRNAPPSPANYAQRVGRAGRRLRIGFVSTFCSGTSHERHAFEHPEWLISGKFSPPRIRLDNARIVERHLRSLLLERLEAQLPDFMGELLDDSTAPTRWNAEMLDGLLAEVRDRTESLQIDLAALFSEDRRVGRTRRFDRAEVDPVVDRFERELVGAIDGWWKRVAQVKREFDLYSEIGSPRYEQKKAGARRRAFHDLTKDRERAYSLNFLSTQGLLPAYQFPLDTFQLDPGVEDTSTIQRAAVVGLSEFAPGNYVYANGRKLMSIRVLYAGGRGAAAGAAGRTDAETSGRVVAYGFCDACQTAVETPASRCRRCDGPLNEEANVLFVEDFEAEETLRIGADEESRERRRHVIRQGLLAEPPAECRLYAYPRASAEYRRLAKVLVTNWGRSAGGGTATKFDLCPDCGRHQRYDARNAAQAQDAARWQAQHQRYCAGQPTPFVLGYRFETDCLVVSVPRRMDSASDGSPGLGSPALVTLAQALKAGAASLLELEETELGVFVIEGREERVSDEIVFFETVPGGAGYVEEMARRLPEVARAAQERLYEHDCSRGCYLCLKDYRNQHWHVRFDKETIRDELFTLAHLSPVNPVAVSVEEGAVKLAEALESEVRESQAGSTLDEREHRYRRGHIEEPLAQAIARQSGLPAPDREHEILDGDRLVTVPDFAWPEVKLAVYCDGFAVHGQRDVLERDARKRNFLQHQGWMVLCFWGRQILGAPADCAAEISRAHAAACRPGRRH